MGDRRLSTRSLMAIAALLAIVVAPTALLLLDSDGGQPATEFAETGFLGQESPAPSKLRKATVWAVGDGAEEGGSGEPVAAMIDADQPDVFLYLGDVYENGTAEEFRDNYEPTYGRLKAITLPTPGNHEWPNAGEGYLPYWSDAAGGRTPSWYSAEVAGWELISLNSEIASAPGSPQARWLEREVEEAGTCRLVFAHRPRYGAGHHGDEPGLASLWNRVKGRAKLFVAGHDHNMQRLRPIDGIVSLIAGSGGRERYEVREDDPRLAFAEDGVNGALKLELEPGRAWWSFVSEAGDVLDRGRVACRPLSR